MARRYVAGLKQPFEFSLRIPGSKSITLRQLAISALCSRPSTLHGFTENDDVNAMATALNALNVKVDTDDLGNAYVDPSDFDAISDIKLDLQMSGVSLRIMCAIAGLRSGTTTLIGHPSLAARPNSDLLTALRDLGCEVESNDGKLPIRIKGPISSNEVMLNTNVSSQFLSALLLVAPCLSDGLTIHLEGEIPSASYVQLTLNELRKRAINAPALSKTLHIQSSEYAGGSIDIEGDASAMTYHAALATLHASKVHILNLGSLSRQGDMQFLELCKELGAEVSSTDTTVSIKGPDRLLSLDEVDMYDFPDSATTVMAMAPFLPKPIKINGLDTLPRKECDRLVCPAKELTKAGIDVDYGSDYMRIKPGVPKCTSFSTYDDHRMAMSFAVLGTKTEGCWIENPDCVSKTYPHFWGDLAKAYR